MLEITNLVTPSPEDWEVTIKGMRLPMKSGDKSDSFILEYEPRAEDPTAIYYVNHELLGREWQLSEEQEEFVNNPKGDWISWIESETRYYLGEKDKQLLLNLCKAGDPSHRKVLRQLPVKCFITAPLYWWKQVDQYKVGTVTNSESTMHCLVKEPFKLEDFDIKNFLEVDPAELDILDCEFDTEIDKTALRPTLNGLFQEESMPSEDFFKLYLLTINGLRDKYLKTNDKKYWHAINELLPQSYNQTRCWSGNYETLVNIVNQRKGHRLSEWKAFIDYMLENVPYLKDIVKAINETND